MDSDSDSDSSESDNLLQLILDKEEEERKQKENLLKALLVLATSTIAVGLSDADNPFYRDRLEWFQHVSHLNSEGPNAFYSMYRMHYPSFMKLCDLIDHDVKKNCDMAGRRTQNTVGAITTPIALHCCIRWLAGGSHHDIRLTAGMGKTSFYCWRGPVLGGPRCDILRARVAFSIDPTVMWD